MTSYKISDKGIIKHHCLHETCDGEATWIEERKLDGELKLLIPLCNKHHELYEIITEEAYARRNGTKIKLR